MIEKSPEMSHPPAPTSDKTKNYQSIIENPLGGQKNDPNWAVLNALLSPVTISWGHSVL